MNKHAAADWLGLFLENRSIEMSTLITQVCPMPTAKLVDVKSVYMEKKLHGSRICAVVPSLDPDSGAIDATKQLLASYSSSTSIGRHIIYRGSFSSKDKILQTIERTYPLPSWCLSPSTSSSLSSLPASITVCSNGQTNAISLINVFLRRARKQLDAKAYLHWYERYGIDTSDFMNAFEQCEQIVGEYDELS
ncbi:hypothetical protein THRCLA_20121 [Thraustotheca clavata]|uniref:Uncharacterized protein n=1 Tax=Thraustotheca clavata TaxID=74557 RepID=A0A1W0ABB3_9STRA|nr:hypothetical protein THRCLA_20121 [Thraustotheca clavata]